MNELEKKGSGTSLEAIVEQTALNVQAVVSQMGVLVAGFNDLKNHMNTTDQAIERLDTRMDGWEERERISVSDSRRLKLAIHSRCFYILGIKHSKGVVSEKSMSDYKKYFAKFCSRCYTDARNKSRLGTPYYDTRKQDFEETMKYIENWEPEVSFGGFTGTVTYKMYLNSLQEL